MNSIKTMYAIHKLSNELKEKLRIETHHYCDVFTKNLLAALPEKVYVENIEYDVNKQKRVLIISYDGKLNLWQNAPTFYSSIHVPAEIPIKDSSGNIVSMVTGSQDGNYPIACFDGYSGKFETKRDWKMVHGNKDIIYGDRTFDSREELWKYLDGKKLGTHLDLQAIVVISKIPRIILFDLVSGLEVAHNYVRGDFEVLVCENYH